MVDGSNRWSTISGVHSVGRFAVASTRLVSADETADGDGDEKQQHDKEAPKAGAAAASVKMERGNGEDAKAGDDDNENDNDGDEAVGEVADTANLGVEMDLMIGQMTLRSKHLQALESNVANHPDVKLIFGDSTMQASLLEMAEHRKRFRLVGLGHELEYWESGHRDCPPLGDQWGRDYDPSELEDGEAWVAKLFEPVRKNFFDGPQPPPMQFLMPEKALRKDAEVALLCGLHQSIGGPWKLVVLFRRLKW